MALTLKLTDLQLLLLTTAAQRPDGSLLPPPDSIPEQRGRIAKSVASLIKRGLACEVDARDAACSWREDAGRLIGTVISDCGRIAIGVEVGAPPPEASSDDARARGLEQVAPDGRDDVAERDPSGPFPRDGSKQALVVSLMVRAQGATLPELVEATGWLPHTTRAALTGLRKKGHVISKRTRSDANCYHIDQVA